MIARTMNATFLNRVANHPDVRPYIGGFDPIDLTEVAANPANIVLEDFPNGGWVLVQQMPAVYELHTLFLPDSRGKAYFIAAREALRYVFTNTDALEILTKCPDDNPGARMAATMVGFRERFHRDACWNVGSPAECGVSFQALTVDDWMARDKQIAKEGHAFHDTLEAAKKACGSVLAVHPEDEAHDRAVGACVLMVKGGQTQKGVAIYNRWSAFAGYANIQAITSTVIDVVDAVIEIRDGAMGVLLVRGLPPKT